MIQPKKPRPYLRKKVEKAGLLLAKGLTFEQVAKKVRSCPKSLKGWAAFFNWQLPAKAEPEYKKKQQAAKQKRTKKAQKRQAVKHLLDAGATHQEIRAKLNLSWEVFNRHLKHFGIATSRQQLKRLKEQAQRYYELAEMETEAIDQELRLAIGTVAKWVTAGKWNNGRPTIKDIKHKARCLYELQGLQVEEIAECCGLPIKTVNHWRNGSKWRMAFEAEKQKLAQELNANGAVLKIIAIQCQVSEKTIISWTKTQGWKGFMLETTQQQQARKLFESGMLQTEISLKCGVSERSLTQWKKCFKWKKLDFETTQQQQARKLFESGTKQKWVALQCGISEKSVGNWKKRFAWAKAETL